MRTSRVVFTGIAVAAAAVAGTSAFTASNTLPATGVNGYGESTSSGANITNIQYNPLSSDNSYLDTVVFTTTTDLTGKTETMTLKNGATVIGTAYTCSYDGVAKTVTCTVGTPAVQFSAFDTVGLTVF